MMSRRYSAICTTAIFAVLSVPAAALAWDAVVVPSTRKVIPATTLEFPTSRKAVIQGCRNEWEAFQIVIQTDGTESGVNVNVSDLTDSSGHVIPSSSATLYREWFLNVGLPSGAGIEVPNHLRRAGLYPDPLIPFVDPYSESHPAVAAPFNITAEDPGLAAVWVDIRIPVSAVPGLYTGSVAVTAEGRQAITVPVELTVWELDMPNEKTMGSSFRLGEGSIREYHGGTDPDQTSADYRKIVRNYYLAGHDHRIDPTGFTGPVEFNFDEAGALLPVDWTAYDEYMAPFVDGTYFPDGVGVTRFDVGLFRPGRSRDLTDDQYKSASRALAEHLNQKGWWHKAWVYSTDEPWLNGGDAEWAEVIRDATLLHEGTDLWKGHVLVTGPMYNGAEDVVGIWCPVQPMYGKWYWTDNDYAGRGDYDTHMANGGELWFYNCNGNVPPFAGYDIDTTIGYEPRILKWGSFFERATGYLYWRQLYWSYFDPWREQQAIDEFGSFFARNGDGLLLYPGDGYGVRADPGTPPWLSIDGPIVSFRLKQIREGMEDWEMFILAEKAGLGDWVRNEITTVYRRFGNFMQEDCSTENYYCPTDEPWTLDENVLIETRQRIAAKLLFTLYPDRYPDPDAPVVTEDEGLPTESAESAEVVEFAEGPASDADAGAVVDAVPTDSVSNADSRSDSVQNPDESAGDTEGRSSGGCSVAHAGSPDGGNIVLIMTTFAVMLAACSVLSRKSSRRKDSVTD